MAGVLSRARIHGLVTNRDLLVEILRDESFLDGEMSTAFLGGDASFEARFARTSTTVRASLAPRREGDAGAPIAAALALAERARTARTVQQRLPVAWRNVPSQPQVTAFQGFDDDVSVAWWGTRSGYVVDGHTVVAASPTAVTLETDGVRTTYDVAVSGASIDVDHPGGHRRLTVVPRFVDPADAVASGSLLAPMPGTVVRVGVEAGQEVAAGDVVLVLEAMKMQHTVTAPAAGTVTEINVQPGAQVAAGEVLAVVESVAEGEAQ